MALAFAFVNEVASRQFNLNFLRGLKALLLQTVSFNTFGTEEVQCLQSCTTTGSLPGTEREITDTCTGPVFIALNLKKNVVIVPLCHCSLYLLNWD